MLRKSYTNTDIDKWKLLYIYPVQGQSHNSTNLIIAAYSWRKCFLKLVIRRGSHVLEGFNLFQVLSHEDDTPT